MKAINLKDTNELNTLTLSHLTSILYQLDWNGSWDDNEEGQEPMTKAEAINYILDMVNESEMTEWYVIGDSRLMHFDAETNLYYVRDLFNTYRSFKTKEKAIQLVTSFNPSWKKS